MRSVLVSLITAEEFQPYGTFLDPSNADPRLNFTIDASNPRDDARANLALIRAPRALVPLTIDTLERHPHSTQCFLPLGDTSYLVVVTLPTRDGQPDLETLAAFSVPAGIGIAYHPTTWHAGMSYLGGPGHFAMFIYEAGTADDCVYEPIPPVQLISPAQNFSLGTGI